MSSGGGIWALLFVCFTVIISDSIVGDWPHTVCTSNHIPHRPRSIDLVPGIASNITELDVERC